MTTKRLLRRARATDDIDDAIDHYLDEGGVTAAGRCIDSLEATFRQIPRFPGAGSPRYGIELDLEDLRSMPMQRYPYLVFYVERADVVEILRVLRAHRDIPPLLE